MSELKALGVHIYAGGFTVGVSKHFEPLGHLEEGDVGYGSPSAKLNFPWLPMVAGLPNWAPWIDDLRERRGTPDLVYCNPPCFSADTKVMTELGPRTIKSLVRERSTARVWSYDENTQRMVLRPITGWHENPYEGSVYDIHSPNYSKGGRKLSRARATGNHSFLTKRGWVRSEQLTEKDLVCTGRWAPNQQQRALIDGMLLGDSTIKKHQAQLVTSQISHGYVALKRQALADFVCGEWLETEGADWGDGYTRQPQAGFYLKTSGWVKRERARWYDEKGKKRVPLDLELTPLTLAAWYMDDGAGRSANIVHLCTDGFTPADVELLVEKLHQVGVEASSFENGSYTRIKIADAGVSVFMRLVAPYVLPEMRYKLRGLARAPIGRPRSDRELLLLEGDQLPEFDPMCWELGEPVVDWDHVQVTKLDGDVKTTVYCLDVQDTHNFVTHGGVAHNCAAFSVAGATMRGGGQAWRTDARLSCWHNCFSVMEQLQPKFYVVESVTRAFTAAREFIDGFVERGAELGYSTTHLLVDAKWHGVAQVRKRYFMIMHKTRLSMGAPNWGPPKTAAEALAEVEDPGFVAEIKDPVQREMMLTLPQGKPMRPIWEAKMRETVGPESSWPRNSSGVAGRPRLFLHRIKPDSPIGTITGDYFIHPTEDRMLGMTELMHLNGFPQDYRFENHPRYWPSLIARGVSPKVAEYLARNIAHSIRTPISQAVQTNVIDYRLPPN